MKHETDYTNDERLFEALSMCPPPKPAIAPPAIPMGAREIYQEYLKPCQTYSKRMRTLSLNRQINIPSAPSHAASRSDSRVMRSAP
jgi:hypothetical protein